MKIKLSPFWDREARLARRLMRDRLLRQRGFRQRLKRKKVDNRRPLGFGKSAGGLPRRLTRGKITTKKDGFVIDYTTQRKIGWFHRGFEGQNRPPRPIVGLNKGDEKEITARAATEATKQITKLMKA